MIRQQQARRPGLGSQMLTLGAGRVKTLHPGVHGGILARRDKDDHMQAIAQHKINPIDVVGAIPCISLEQCLEHRHTEEQQYL